MLSEPVKIVDKCIRKANEGHSKLEGDVLRVGGMSAPKVWN